MSQQLQCSAELSLLPSHRQPLVIILVARAVYLRKGNCRIGKDKVNVLTVLHSFTNIPLLGFSQRGWCYNNWISQRELLCVHLGHRRFSLCAWKQSWGQLLALVYNIDWLVPESCCVAKRGRQTVAGTQGTLQNCCAFPDLQVFLGFIHRLWENLRCRPMEIILQVQNKNLFEASG